MKQKRRRQRSVAKRRPSSSGAAESRQSQKLGKQPVVFAAVILILTGILVGVALQKGQGPTAKTSPWSRSADAPTNASATATGSEELQLDLNSVESLKAYELDLIDRLLLDYPNHTGALGLAGSVHNFQGDHSLAVDYWQKVLSLNPQDADACHAIAMIAFLREENERALQFWRRAAELDPARVNIHFHLGQTLLLMGDTAGATEAFRRDIDIAPTTSQSHYLLGQIYRDQGAIELAREQYLKAIEVQPDSAKAYYGLGILCAQQGEEAESGNYLAAFRKLKASEAATDRKVRGASDDLQILQQRVARTCTQVGEVYLTKGNAGTAESLWRQAAFVDPRNLPSRVYLSTLYQQSGRTAEALAACEVLTQLEPANPLRHLNAGVLLARMRRFEEASRSFEKVIELAPKRPEGHRLLAQMKLEIPQRAREALVPAEQAVKLDPNGANCFLLAQARIANDDGIGALQAMEQAMALEPQNPQYQALYETLKNRR